jgi:hypothetical protein
MWGARFTELVDPSPIPLYTSPLVNNTLHITHFYTGNGRFTHVQYGNYGTTRPAHVRLPID